MIRSDDDQNKTRILFPKDTDSLRLLSRCEVDVRYVFKSGVTCPRKLIDRMNHVWNNLVEKDRLNGKLVPFDSVKFRLSSCSATSAGCELFVDIAPYRYYLAIRSDPEIFDILIDLARKTGIPNNSYLPNVIGNVAVVITADAKIMGIVRSSNVSTYTGCLDLPGGHPEPNRITTGDMSRLSSNDIRNELFDSVVREVIEDIPIDIRKISEPKLLSILSNVEDVCKPDMVFVIHVELCSTDIMNRFHVSRHTEVEKLVAINLLQSDQSSLQYHITPIAQRSMELAREFYRMQQK